MSEEFALYVVVGAVVEPFRLDTVTFRRYDDGQLTVTLPGKRERFLTDTELFSMLIVLASRRGEEK